jgi:hypothetical protein
MLADFATLSKRLDTYLYLTRRFSLSSPSPTSTYELEADDPLDEEDLSLAFSSFSSREGDWEGLSRSGCLDGSGWLSFIY